MVGSVEDVRRGQSAGLLSLSLFYRSVSGVYLDSRADHHYIRLVQVLHSVGIQSWRRLGAATKDLGERVDLIHAWIAEGPSSE